MRCNKNSFDLSSVAPRVRRRIYRLLVNESLFPTKTFFLYLFWRDLWFCRGLSVLSFWSFFQIYGLIRAPPMETNSKKWNSLWETPRKKNRRQNNPYKLLFLARRYSLRVWNSLKLYSAGWIFPSMNYSLANCTYLLAFSKFTFDPPAANDYKWSW